MSRMGMIKTLAGGEIDARPGSLFVISSGIAGAPDLSLTICRHDIMAARCLADLIESQRSELIKSIDLQSLTLSLIFRIEVNIHQEGTFDHSTFTNYSGDDHMTMCASVLISSLVGRRVPLGEWQTILYRVSWWHVLVSRLYPELEIEIKTPEGSAPSAAPMSGMASMSGTIFSTN